MKQSDWADFPRENVLYQLDVVFKNNDIENKDAEYSIIHYAAFFKDNHWVDANSFESIYTENAYQISYAPWYKISE